MELTMLPKFRKSNLKVRVLQKYIQQAQEADNFDEVREIMQVQNLLNNLFLKVNIFYKLLNFLNSQLKYPTVHKILNDVIHDLAWSSLHIIILCDPDQQELNASHTYMEEFVTTKLSTYISEEIDEIFPQS